MKIVIEPTIYNVYDYIALAILLGEIEDGWDISTDMVVSSLQQWLFTAVENLDTLNYGKLFDEMIQEVILFRNERRNDPPTP